MLFDSTCILMKWSRYCKNWLWLVELKYLGKLSRNLHIDNVAKLTIQNVN